MDNLFVVILSRNDATGEVARNAIRETWGKGLNDIGIQYRFLLGAQKIQNPRQYEKSDVLILPCPDDYRSLPQKTYNACKWIIANQPQTKHLFKCDDDTFIHPQRLKNFSINGDYIGVGVGDGTASGGGGYLLSYRAVSIVAKELKFRTGPEDVLVARTLKRRGIHLVDCRLFDHAVPPNKPIIPTKENNQITTHYVKPDQMKEIYDSI